MNFNIDYFLIIDVVSFLIMKKNDKKIIIFIKNLKITN